MAYRDFTLEKVIRQFNLKLNDTVEMNLGEYFIDNLNKILGILSRGVMA